MNRTSIKISIIGAGYVGSTTAFTLMLSGLASDIVIVDINKEKAEGEVMDLMHGASFVKPVSITYGEYEDTKNSDIVILTAGANQKDGETRLDMVSRNANILKGIVPNITKYSPECIILVVSNPVDILTYITYKLSGFPKERVIGSGTVLDTSRFKSLLSEHFKVDARNVHSYIMGEHGDSEFAAWSLTSISCLDIDTFCSKTKFPCDDSYKTEIPLKVKNAAYDIIKRKGATYYAIALAIQKICETIIRDEHSVLTVSSLLEGEYGINGIYIGVPCIVGETGVQQVLEANLDESELSKLQESAKILKEIDEKIKL